MGDLVKACTKAQARKLTEQIKAGAESLWHLLLEAQERRAWWALGYGSWREYAQAEFELSQSRVYQLLDAAKVQRVIAAAPDNSTRVENEAQARELKPLLNEPDELVAAWDEAVTESDGKAPSAVVVKAAVKKRVVPPPSELVVPVPVVQGLMLVLSIHQPEADQMMSAAMSAGASLETWAYGILLAAVTTPARARAARERRIDPRAAICTPVDSRALHEHVAGPMLSGGIHRCTEKGCEARKVGGRWVEEVA